MSLKPHFSPTAAELYGNPLTPSMSGAHVAASHEDPALVGWEPSIGSPDVDLLDDLGTLRARGRDLERNDGFAGGANQTYQDNIVGHQIVLRSTPDIQLLGWDREQGREWAKKTQALFQSWASIPRECDAGSSLTLLGMTWQALSGWFQNGDSLAIPHWLPRPGMKWNTRLQMVESDRLETPPLFEGQPNVRGGIRFDSFDAPVRYYFRRNHPGDMYAYAGGGANEYRSIPAYTSWGRPRVIHMLNKERPGQSRGKMLLSRVIREFHLSSKYKLNELHASAANSLVAGILETALSQEHAASLFGANAKEWKKNLREWRPQLRPGATVPLPPGTSFKGFAPNRPNSAFEAFTTAVHRHQAAGLNMSYELFAKDFSKVNYSSARASLLEVWRFWLGRRRWLTDLWLGPIYAMWLEEAINAGYVEAPDFYENRHAYLKCRWVFAGRGWIDPAKEANASVIRRKNRITSLEKECAEDGEDWEDMIDQIAEEEKYMRDRGVDYTLPEAQTVAVQSGSDSQSSVTEAESDEAGGDADTDNDEDSE